MSIRWVHETHRPADLRLMTLHDIWVVGFKKDKEITYAELEGLLQAESIRPVAISDKQVAYYAVEVTGRPLGDEGWQDLRYMTGEEFFSRIYQPFGPDEFLTHTPLKFVRQTFSCRAEVESED